MQVMSREQVTTSPADHAWGGEDREDVGWGMGRSPACAAQRSAARQLAVLQEPAWAACLARRLCARLRKRERRPAFWAPAISQAH